MAIFDKYNQENSDIESLPEEARFLLQDKDALINALQASHDAHTVRIDTLEDRLVSTELHQANDLAMAVRLCHCDTSCLASELPTVCLSVCLAGWLTRLLNLPTLYTLLRMPCGWPSAIVTASVRSSTS
jgi:hypothetical protein